ncbi:hypothetical protein ACQP2K_42095 [Microbispora siamensis]
MTLFDTVAGRQLGVSWTVTTGTFDPYAMADPMPALAFTADSSLLRVVGHDGAFQDLPADPAKAVPPCASGRGTRSHRRSGASMWEQT